MNADHRGGRAFIRCGAAAPRQRGHLVLQLLLALLLGAVPMAEAQTPRFFFSGDGVLAMRRDGSGDRLRVRYRDAHGSYDPAALAQIDHFFRSRSDGAIGHVSLRLIELIDFVEDSVRPTSLSLVSGYRSPAFNRSLHDAGHRVAQASLHTEGLAADIAPAGVNLRRVWMQLRQLETGGVGLYQKDGFLHVDTGPPRFWEPATSGVEKNLSAHNARLFARTDFDRYADIEGAVIGVHGVTALPLRVSQQAQLGNRMVTLAPRGAAVLENDCLVWTAPAGAYEIAVTAPATPSAQRAPLRLRTCSRSAEGTPEEILTNPVARWH